MKSPEFSEDADKIGNNFPNVKDAPFPPTDVRSDNQWDRDARSLEALRDDGTGIPAEAGPNSAKVDRDFENLRAKAQAYKKDDPASGPVDAAIPKYRPRAARP